MFKRIAVVFAMVFFAAAVAHGYEAADVKNGGTLKGKAVFKGAAPKDDVIAISKDAEVCGKEQKLGKYLIKDSMVKNVVVWIDGIKKGKALPQKPVDITIKNCRVEPLVSVGFVGGKYVFRNDDPIMHTVQLKLGLEYQKKASGRPVKEGASVYNLAMPKKGMQIEKPIKEFHRYTQDTGYLQVKSNIHDCIRGYVFVFDHPYAAVTDDKGSFAIDDLPAGEYTLRIWHEGLGTQEKKVKIAAGGVSEIDIEMGK
jgi:hypothetical protein